MTMDFYVWHAVLFVKPGRIPHLVSNHVYGFGLRNWTTRPIDLFYDNRKD